IVPWLPSPPRGGLGDGPSGTIDLDDNTIDAPNVCRNSFSADTTVETPFGDVPISEIEIGDIVIAYDTESGESGEYTVTDTISHEDEAKTFVTIDGEEIETTPWHLFLTDEGWVEAINLQPNDVIVSLDGFGLVDAVVVENTNDTMYDLTVEDVHNFAVGEGDWVVHNCVAYGSESVEDLTEELANQGTRFSRENMVAITRNPDGTVMWLESGSNRAGLQHIMERHGSNFADKLNANNQEEVVELVMNSINNRTPIATRPTPGDTRGGTDYLYDIDGSNLRVSVGGNGFIVTAFPDRTGF
ncbi:MAG: Hint domain-containing protein, partial [Bacteroidota bacterium]